MSETNKKETFGPFTLNTLCNQNISFKIPFEYSEFAQNIARKCNPNATNICLTCQPLEKVGIDLVNDTNYTPELLGVGSYNDVYTLPIDGENKNAVIRLFKPESRYYRGILLDINQENFGAFIQTYLSKSKVEGGLGCPYINKVYDFGEYESESDAVRFTRVMEKKIRPRNVALRRKIDGKWTSTIQVNKNPKPYMILESLKMDLSDKIKDNDNITSITLLRYFQQILLGLKCMHDNNLFHLDIKPANIMVDNDDNIRLVDFGMTVPITKEFAGGTPKYWSFTYVNKEYREQNRMPIDDLWSVGLTILELLKLPIKAKRINLMEVNLNFKGSFYGVDKTRFTDFATQAKNDADSYGEEGIAIKKIMYALLNIFFVPIKGTFSTGLGRIRTTLTSRNDPFLTNGITEDTNLDKIKPRYESSNNHILTCEWLLDNFLGYPEGYSKEENTGGKRRKTRKRRYKKKSMKGKKKH